MRGSMRSRSVDKLEGAARSGGAGNSAVSKDSKPQKRGAAAVREGRAVGSSLESHDSGAAMVDGGKSGVSIQRNDKRRLARRKKEPLVVSTIKQAWNKEKVKQRKTYGKTQSSPSTEDISLLGSQVLPGEELSGDEEYWQQRRDRNLPKVSNESETEKVGRWLGDTTSGEYMDLASQPNPSQSSVSTPTNRPYLPPRDLPDISPLDRGPARPVPPQPLSPLDTNTLGQSHSNRMQTKMKKQNQLWDKMKTGSKSQTPSPGMMEGSSPLPSPTPPYTSPTMSQLIPNSCQVEVNDTFDNLIPALKSQPLQAPKLGPAPSSPALFCSQMSSLDDSLPMLLSPGVSININKSLESEDSGDEARRKEGMTDGGECGFKTVEMRPEGRKG